MHILTLDIETSPNLAHVWGLWDQNIPLNMLAEAGEVICFSAKWLDRPKTLFFRGPDMVASAWELLDQADVVVHYNGKKFDIPWLNTEFKRAGVRPPSPSKQVDLLNVVRSRFKLPSYKLQYVATWLGLGGKAETGGFELWKGVMRDDPAAWKRMEKYNRQDVILTEQVYLSLLPWIGGHPSRQLYDGGTGCPTCGSPELIREGFAYTKVGKFQQYSCRACGSWHRGSKRIGGVDIQESVR